MELGNAIFGNSRGHHPVNRGMQDEWHTYMEECGFDGYGYHDLSDERGIFENAVFRIQPYYWGDCECDYEAKTEGWSKANDHRAGCYQDELSGRLRAWEIENGYDAVKTRAYGRDADPFFGGFDVESETSGPVTSMTFTPRTDDALKALISLDKKRDKFRDGVLDDLCKRHKLDRRFGCMVHCTCDYNDRWATFAEDNEHAPDCRIGTPNFTHKPSGFMLEWYKYPLRDSYSSAPLTPKLMRSMWADCIASMTAPAGEAGTAETPQSGSAHEHAVAKPDAQQTPGV